MSFQRLFCVLRTMLLTGCVLLMAVGFGAGNSHSAYAETASTLDRTLEPVVLSNMTVLAGVPTGELCAYRYTGSSWEQIPFQVDERDSNGDYVAAEDSLLDANDEIVVMAADLGSAATTSITTEPGIADPAYLVEVANPLNPSAKGWFYLVRLTEGVCNSGRDYAAYDAANLRLNAQDYAVGWSNSFNGLDRFFLFNGDDILDRTKLYARADFITINEETASLLQPVALIKDGPVRVIIERGTELTFGYASLLVSTTPVPLNLLPGFVNIDEVRISFDLVPGTTGTYYNENTLAGVSIDGVQDTVPAALTKAWRQISLASGTMIEVVDLGQLSGTRQHYYQDMASCGSGDTGDGQCWGDSGYAVLNPAKEAFTLVGTRYILPGNQANLGETYYNYASAPLTTSITQDTLLTEKIYLPLIRKYIYPNESL